MAFVLVLPGSKLIPMWHFRPEIAKTFSDLSEQLIMQRSCKISKGLRLPLAIT